MCSSVKFSLSLLEKRKAKTKVDKLLNYYNNLSVNILSHLSHVLSISKFNLQIIVHIYHFSHALSNFKSSFLDICMILQISSSIVLSNIEIDNQQSIIYKWPLSDCLSRPFVLPFPWASQLFKNVYIFSTISYVNASNKILHFKIFLTFWYLSVFPVNIFNRPHGAVQCGYLHFPPSSRL